MSERGQSNDDSTRQVLYQTMAQEAAGLYSQMLTICSAFLGGSLALYDRLVPENPIRIKWFLFCLWGSLVYPVIILLFVRWRNIESHRLVLESQRLGGEGLWYKEKHEEAIRLYEKARRIAQFDRRLMLSAIVSLMAGLVLLATLVTISRI